MASRRQPAQWLENPARVGIFHRGHAHQPQHATTLYQTRAGFTAEAPGAIEAYPRFMGANTANSAPLGDVARVAAEDFRRGRESVISAALARELAAAIELALLTAVRAERRACAAECTRRGQLWQRTADQPETSELIKVEADHRANEALYLGDLLATRGG